jgi:hypothetical protein
VNNGAHERRIFFRLFDVEYPCIEYAATKQNGEKLELYDGAPDPDPPLLLRWVPKTEPPDFLYSVSGNLYVSEWVRQCWSLASCREYSLIPLHLVSRRGDLIRDDYWWINLKSEYSIMDESRSECTKSGPVFLRVHRFCVDWASVPHHNLFLCSEVHAAVFSERFAEIARVARLTGVVFTEVSGGRWPPKET